MKPILRSMCYLLHILILVGCIHSTTSIKSTQEIMKSTVTVLPATMTPLITYTFTSTASTTPSPSTTIVPTEISTLVPKIAKETMQPLLEDPLNCTTLCFWGIVPGETSFAATKNYFNQLGFIPFEDKDLYTGRDFYTITINNNNGELNSYVTFFPMNNIVKNIEVTPNITQTMAGIHSDWIAYSPDTLINQFGKPSRVGIALDYGPNFAMAMTLSFDDIQLIAFYDGYNMVPDRPTTPLFCPTTAPFDMVTLYMGENPPNPPLEGIPLEEATSITIDQFTQLMVGDPLDACFKVNGELFK